MLTVTLEDLVENQESESRRLLAGIGVEWDAACLDFHLSRRPVLTASQDQVRRPLNSEGIGRWRRFEPWLGPLRDALMR